MVWRKPGERVLAQLDARVEAVAKECSPQNMANLAWAYATVGALDARAVVLSTDCGVREDALHVGGRIRTGESHYSTSWVEVALLFAPMLVASILRSSTRGWRRG